MGPQVPGAPYTPASSHPWASAQENPNPSHKSARFMPSPASGSAPRPGEAHLAHPCPPGHLLGGGPPKAPLGQKLQGGLEQAGFHGACK
ncbi:hypothetical protein FJNA_13530 [Thermus sp. FJN-A]